MMGQEALAINIGEGGSLQQISKRPEFPHVCPKLLISGTLLVVEGKTVFLISKMLREFCIFHVTDGFCCIVLHPNLDE